MRRSLVWLLVLMLSACTLTQADSSVELTPIATPDLPQVSFQFPQNGSIVYEGTDLTVDIVAQDDTVGIERIEFFVNGVPMQTGEPEEIPVPVFRVNMNWFSQGLGAHTLSAVAYRPDGTPSDEEIIRIEVIPREDQAEDQTTPAETGEEP